MKSRPILFTPENAQKVHDGTKVQTRRIVKPQPKIIHALYGDASLETERIFRTGDQRIHCPYGTVGDRLWVRESCYISPKDFCDRDDCNWQDDTGYPRLISWSNSDGEAERDYKIKKTPSIFVPKWACRTWLELTEVRVERVQDISVDDAIAEGAGDWIGECPLRDTRLCKTQLQFAALWESIYGDDAWDKNQWVWVLSFRKIEGD